MVDEKKRNGYGEKQQCWRVFFHEIYITLFDMACDYLWGEEEKAAVGLVISNGE